MTGIIEALLSRKLITTKHIDLARSRQAGTQKSIQELLVEMGFITADDLIDAYSKTSRIPVVNLLKTKIDFSLTKILSEDIAKRYSVFPLHRKGNALVLAMSNPEDVVALDDINSMLDMRIEPVLAKKADIEKCIEKHYHLDDTVNNLLKDIVYDAKIKSTESDQLNKGVFDVDNDKFKASKIVRLVNCTLNDAIKKKASDIHIEPQDGATVIRYRMDGKLKQITKVHSMFHPALVARIKILTKLDIAESKKPQDGRVRISINDRNIDLRISTMPTFYGEKIVLRLLDPKEAKVELDKLGFHREGLNTFMRAIQSPQGMFLATGPTGSGKTSTLYAALNAIKDDTKNIVTIEDPIEYLMKGVNQIQVNPIKNITFVNGLRNILRQDPDVVLVGEIRDKETAEIAFRAALTGHMVFSTLHTNSAVASITRLLDIGLEPFLISSSLSLVVAQRLIRLICPECKKAHTPDRKILDKFEFYTEQLNIRKFYKGAGCRHCSFTGYYGRTALFEILPIDKKIKELIIDRACEEAILNEAKKRGLKTLLEFGMEKVAQGVATLEEVGTTVCVSDEERRKCTRHPIHCPIEYNYKNNGLKNSSVMLNVSKSGAMISSNEAMNLTEDLTLNVCLKNRSFNMPTKVAHIQSENKGKPPYRVGLKFLKKEKSNTEDFLKEIGLSQA